MSNEPNKPAELTEKELAGIAGGMAPTEEMLAKMEKKGVTGLEVLRLVHDASQQELQKAMQKAETFVSIRSSAF